MQTQLINQTDDRPNYGIVSQNSASTAFLDMTKNTLMSKHGMTEQEWALLDAEVSISLMHAKAGYFNQCRNLSDSEYDMLAATWLEMFAPIERGILHEAVMRFIRADFKGFFPTPGQVMGFVEEILEERRRKARTEAFERECERLEAHNRRVQNGENCSTCQYCQARTEMVGSPIDPREETRLFCQNPDSYKFEGNFGYGTAATILCGLYKRKLQIGSK